MRYVCYELRTLDGQVLDRADDPDKLDWDWAHREGWEDEDLKVVKEVYDGIYDCRPED